MDIGKSQQWLSRRSIGLGLVMVALLGSSVFALRYFTTQRAAPVEEATPAPQQVAVAALGRLEPRGEVIDVSGPTGDRIGRLEVKEGDFVQKGQVLAYLESYDESLAERNYAASQLAEAQKQLRAEGAYGTAQVQEAETRLRQIDRPQAMQIEAQQATVRQLEAELSLAQTDLDRYQGLFAEGAITRQDLDQQVTEVRKQQEELNNAKANLVRLESARSTDLQNAEAQVQSQRASLRRSQAQVDVDSATRNLQLAEAKLDRTIIRAPEDGEVLNIFTKQSETIGDNGILQLGDTRQMFVVAEVYETDVGLVKLGQRATITSRNGAFDQQISGTVERIGSQIYKNNILDDDPAANADARVVEVRIRLDQSEPVAKLTNLQVDVNIDVKTGANPG